MKNTLRIDTTMCEYISGYITYQGFEKEMNNILNEMSCTEFLEVYREISGHFKESVSKLISSLETKRMKVTAIDDYLANKMGNY